MKAIDSNLLVYASLAKHPAMAPCEQYIAGYPVWVASVVNLVELRRVLVGVYGVSDPDADAKFTDFCKALVVDDLTPTIATAALAVRQSYAIDFNDAVLLETAGRGRIGHRTQMTSWEVQNLPAKGLPRILIRIHRWLEQHDPALVQTFHSATQALSRLV
ncbi:MAG TPA: type II toxin-antitoxin system VapC family toxin [Pirellulales bacterium]|nr:type II toxin-antitoxin system VapC family toxin [Pirellulales bacterium]